MISLVPEPSRVCRRDSGKQFQVDILPDNQLMPAAREPCRIEYYVGIIFIGIFNVLRASSTLFLRYEKVDIVFCAVHAIWIY